MCEHNESRKNHEPKAVGDIITDTQLFAGMQDCGGATARAATGDAAAVEPQNNFGASVPDNIPGTPEYNWQKYGYTLITEETMSGGPHPGDYEKDGVLHCGYCHKPKYILHNLFGKVKAFPIDCDCLKECLARIAGEHRRREELIKAENCRSHALPYAHMRQWNFANDDGGSPVITGYAKHYAEHFAEFRPRGEGLFLFGISGTGKTYTAVQIVNALCDKGYRCLVTSFLDIVTDLLSLNREKRQEYINDICRHDLVVFDNYGTEPTTYFSDMNVLEIVNICYDKFVPVIVATSLSPEILDKENNITRKSALTRLKERCYCLTLANVHRKNKQAKERNDRYRKLLGIAEDDASSQNWPKPGKAGCSKQPAHTSGKTKTSEMPSLYEDMAPVDGAEEED